MSHDPTAFDIQFDPTQQRMRGIALHGNTPFDVPFISQITDTLYVGGCESGLKLPNFIKHVVSLYKWEQYHYHDNLDSVLTVTMYDSNEGPDAAQIRCIAEWVNHCQTTGPTLLHCQAGLNRSNLVAAASLMLEGLSAGEAISLLRERRSPAVLCNQTFNTWLREEFLV